MFIAGFTFAMGAVGALVLLWCAIQALAGVFLAIDWRIAKNRREGHRGPFRRLYALLTRHRRMPVASGLSERIDDMSSKARTWGLIALLFAIPMTLAICLGNR